jgi:excisionase family DNA binding protein
MNDSMSLNEAAKMANCGVSTIRRWATEKLINAEKDQSGIWRISKEAMHQFLVAGGESSHGRRAIRGASSVAHPSPASTNGEVLEVLREALRRERDVNDELRKQNEKIQAQLIQVMHEMQAILNKQNPLDGVISRWLRK